MPHDVSTPLLVLHEADADLPAHPAVVHVEHGISFIQAGTLSFECGERIDVGGGSIVLIPAGLPHRSLGGHGVTYWMTGFCGACQGLDESQRLMAPFLRVRRGALPVIDVPDVRAPWLESLFAELREASLGDTDPDRVSALLTLLLIEVSSYAHAAPPAEDTLIGQALRFIQREAFRPISLADVAKAVHRSPAHVATTVKRSTGHTVGDWIAATRIAEAARWLSHTDAGMDVIAERIGWGDTTHFIRMFKRHHGITPAAWRRRHRHAATQPTPSRKRSTS